MSGLRKIGRIAPTKKNAEAMLTMTHADLLHGGVSPREAWEVADPENTPLVERQLQKLRRHNGRYLGAIAGRQVLGGSIEGFIKANEWGVADQLPFEDEDKKKYEAMARRSRELPQRPLGIFALNASLDHPHHTQLFIAGALLTEVLAQNKGREVRMSLHPDDPLREVVERYDFKPHGQQGAPIPTLEHYVQDLYVRPADS